MPRKRNKLYFAIGLFAILFSFHVAPADAAGENKYAARALRSEKNGADYLVVAPEKFMAELTPLLDKRAADGLRVAAVSPEAISRVFTRATGAEMILSFVRYTYFHWKSPAPKYLLLVGDAGGASSTYSLKDVTIPTFFVPTSVDPKTATDNPYGDMDGDDIPDIAVGRIPADTVEEVRSIVAKIVEYETSAPSGEWRRRVSMFASEGHFGPAFDSLLEEVFKKLVNDNVSPNFDLNMTYASPGMPYFYVPALFGKKVIERFNEGSLFMIYIGHGQVKGFDDVYWGKERIPIMTLKDVPSVDNKGMRQLLFIIACFTGSYAHKTDSVGEQLFKSPTGPIGVFASSEESHPYSNAILSKDIAHAFMLERPETVGIGLLEIKRNLFNGKDASRKFLDSQAKLMFSPKEMEGLNRDHLFMYNYLGDPATRIQYPAEAVEITAPEIAEPGEEIPVSWQNPLTDAVVAWSNTPLFHLTLECKPTDVIYETVDITGLKGEALNKAIERNYKNANNKVAAQVNIPWNADEMPATSITAPSWLPDGEYYLKVYQDFPSKANSMGFARIQIRRRDNR